MATTERPSIRDLIAELADTEDVLRGCRATGARERSARRRQGEILTELRSRHFRCSTA
jgi:hypothetical protein